MTKLLYVDDNATDHLAAQEAFADSGLELCCAASAQAALDELARTPYAAVVCDLMMPGDDGLVFAQEMLQRGQRTPLVFTSGAAILHSFQGYQGLPHYRGFVLKPLTPAKIRPLLPPCA